VKSKISRHHIEQCIESGSREDWPAIIARVAAPSLLLHATGGFGPGAPPLIGHDQIAELATALRDARLVEVPGNHVTMLFGANAGAVVAAIDQFVGAAHRADAARRRLIEPDSVVAARECR
jgi:hypothetical protein